MMNILSPVLSADRDTILKHFDNSQDQDAIMHLLDTLEQQIGQACSYADSWWTHDKPTDFKSQLTRLHIAAIRLYTMSPGSYAMLNYVLRNQNKSQGAMQASDAWAAYSLLLSDALEKAPQKSLNGASRGVNLDLNVIYPGVEVGDDIADLSFTSTTSKTSVAKGFAGNGTLIFYKANTSTAAKVDEWSKFKSEDEAIVHPNKKWYVNYIGAADQPGPQKLELISGSAWNVLAGV